MNNLNKMNDLNDLNDLNYLNYQIDLTQYKLLSNIAPDYLPFVLNDIFSIGYNVWVKNFIRNDPSILNLNLNPAQTENNITDSKLYFWFGPLEFIFLRIHCGSNFTIESISTKSTEKCSSSSSLFKLSII